MGWTHWIKGLVAAIIGAMANAVPYDKTDEQGVTKKLIIIWVIVTVITTSGCSGMGVTIQTDQTAALKAAGYAAGFAIAANNKDLMTMALPYATGILAAARTGEISDDTITAALALIPGNGQEKTIAMAALAMVTVEIKTGTVNSQAVSILEGVISGMQAGIK